ncbi:MAG: response regulator transcription factor [Clostridiales bacterium]|nr:response regulator transcription factor [Clostridiales bacterium]
MARMVELELIHEGYEVTKAYDGVAGLAHAESGGFDLILLDIMLPGLNGMEVLRRLRRITDVPVILLTARDATVDKVSGLDTGADDYITKPFVIEELLARIRAGLRKGSAADQRRDGKKENLVLTAAGGNLVLDVDRHEVKVKNEPVELTLREFSLLQYLLENKGRVLSRDALLEHVWGYDYVGETNAVDVYVRFLRSKVDERFDMKLIHTVRGIGYQIREE